MKEKYPRLDPIRSDEMGFHLWGNILRGDFERMFNEEAMNIPAYDDTDPVTGGYSELRHSTLGSLLDTDMEGVTTLELKALHSAFGFFPQRVENPETGSWKLCSPARGRRPGKKETVGQPRNRSPLGGPDVASGIISGTKRNECGLLPGHAIFLGIHPDVKEFDLDDPFAIEPSCRAMVDLETCAFTVVNKFMPYIRNIDPGIVHLIPKFAQSFVNYPRGIESDRSVEENLISLPQGITFVSFPMKCRESLSDISIYELYSIFKSSQDSVRRIRQAYQSKRLLTGFLDHPNGDEQRSEELPVEDIVEDFFLNVGPYVGGTIPRVHLQGWLRARTLRDKCYERRAELFLRGEHNQRITGTSKERKHLLCENRSFRLYSIEIPSSDFETKIEPKEEKRFMEYNDEELWGFAELIIYNSKVIDRLGAIKDRNVLFYPTGTVTRAFSFLGSMEQGYPMLCTPLTSESMRGSYRNLGGLELTAEGVGGVKIDFSNMYEEPNILRCAEEFRGIINRESPVYRLCKSQKGREAA